MIKNCKSCGKEINPKRLEIMPKTQVCVECSSTEKKQALTMQFGEGDHTYNDIVILEPQQIKDYEDFEEEDSPEFLDFEEISRENLEIPPDYGYKQTNFDELEEDGPPSN